MSTCRIQPYRSKYHRWLNHWILSLSPSLTIKRFARWLRLLIRLNDEERAICEKMRVTKAQYVSAYKELGFRRFR